MTNTSFPRGFVFGKGDGMLDNVRRAVDRSNGFIVPDGVSEFISQNVSSLLISFEAGGERLDLDQLPRFRKMLYELKHSRYTVGLPIFRDSGGYQLQSGALPASSILQLHQANLRLLNHASDLADYSFSLDVVPITGSRLDAQRAMLWNRQILGDLCALPSGIRENIFLIHHFKGQELSQMYRQLLFRDGFAAQFRAFATGGMAASDSPLELPVLPWVLPLVDILSHFEQRQEIPSSLRFHILGLGTQRTALIAGLVSKHIEQEFGVPACLTWDTATGITALSMGAIIQAWDMEENRYVEFSSNSAAMTSKSHRDNVYQLVNQHLGSMLRGSADAKSFPFYRDESTIANLYLVQALLFAASQHRAQEYADQVVQDLYELYRDSKKDFIEGMVKHLMMLSNSQPETLEKEAHQVARSLELLSLRSPSIVTSHIQRYLSAA